MAAKTDSSAPSQFQGLIDTLREKAVEESEQEANRILGTAESRAADILARARKEAEGIISEAEAAAVKREEAARGALRRASRDVLLSLESAIIGQLEAVLKRETRSVVRGEVLANMVRMLVEKWSPGLDAGKLEVLLSEEDLNALRETGWQGLQEDLRSGITLRPLPEVEGGLRIGREGGSVHYDFSATTLAEWLSRFVTPEVREVLREVVEEKDEES